MNRYKKYIDFSYWAPLGAFLVVHNNITVCPVFGFVQIRSLSNIIGENSLAFGFNFVFFFKKKFFIFKFFFLKSNYVNKYKKKLEKINFSKHEYMVKLFLFFLCKNNHL